MKEVTANNSKKSFCKEKSLVQTKVYWDQNILFPSRRITSIFFIIFLILVSSSISNEELDYIVVNEYDDDDEKFTGKSCIMLHDSLIKKVFITKCFSNTVCHDFNSYFE